MAEGRTVREASLEVFRAHGMTTVFGNPGSTELPMLSELPDDFRYVLGLQESVAVGAADAAGDDVLLVELLTRRQVQLVEGRDAAGSAGDLDPELVSADLVAAVDDVVRPQRVGPTAGGDGEGGDGGDLEH